MLGSYLVSALRAIQRDPWHAAVNVAGLAVALAAGLLIALYMRHELSYEDYFTDPDRLYWVDTEGAPPGRTPLARKSTPYSLPELLNADFADQLVATRITTNSAVIGIDGAPTRQRILVGDERLFDVLDFPVVAGDPGAAMSEPGAVILTESTATRLFGDAPAMGQTIRVDAAADLHVAAILKDPPRNTLFSVEMIVSIATPRFDPPPAWADWNVLTQATFVRLTGATRGETIERQLLRVIGVVPDFHFRLGR